MTASTLKKEKLLALKKLVVGVANSNTYLEDLQKA